MNDLCLLGDDAVGCDQVGVHVGRPSPRCDERESTVDDGCGGGVGSGIGGVGGGGGIGGVGGGGGGGGDRGIRA